MTASTDPRAARNDTERAMLEMLRKLPEPARRAFRDVLVAMRDGADLRPHVIALYRENGSAAPEAAADAIMAEWDRRGGVVQG